ncbi:ORFA+B [Vicia faba alphaendornavirus]|uniref:ORFA+B n=1 Tax=Vicia faba endornavirus TaxID=310749 RepID=O82731_VFEV|nr:ORFA+B [Vicia faba alphaendornavirus]CAA04392.1 ORFA+B [Vicia faba alphaendornavirus]
MKKLTATTNKKESPPAPVGDPFKKTKDSVSFTGVKTEFYGAKTPCSTGIYHTTCCVPCEDIDIHEVVKAASRDDARHYQEHPNSPSNPELVNSFNKGLTLESYTARQKGERNLHRFNRNINALVKNLRTQKKQTERSSIYCSPPRKHLGRRPHIRGGSLHPIPILGQSDQALGNTTGVWSPNRAPSEVTPSQRPGITNTTQAKSSDGGQPPNKSLPFHFNTHTHTNKPMGMHHRKRQHASVRAHNATKSARVSPPTPPEQCKAKQTQVGNSPNEAEVFKAMMNNYRRSLVPKEKPTIIKPTIPYKVASSSIDPIDMPRNRPLQSVGALDCYVTGGIQTKDVTGSGTSNLDRFNAMLRTLNKSGMHTSRSTSMTSEFGGRTIGLKKPLDSIIHNVNLRFCHTQVRTSEVLASASKKYESNKNKQGNTAVTTPAGKVCEHSRFDVKGEVEFTCGWCKPCKQLIKDALEVTHKQGTWRRRPLAIAATKKNLKECGSTNMFSKNNLNNFLKYSKPLHKLMKKKTLTAMCFASDPRNKGAIFSTTDAGNNRESSMIGRDLGMTLRLNTLSNNAIQYILHAYTNKTLTHYVSEADYQSFLKSTRKKTSDTPAIEIAPCKRYTHLYPEGSEKNMGGTLLYKLVLQVIAKRAQTPQANILRRDTSLKGIRVGNRVVVPLPSVEHRIQDGYDRGDFGLCMTGHMATRETLLPSEAPYMHEMFGHKCHRCKGITVLTKGHTGDKYDASKATSRGRILNAIKYGVGTDKDLADVYINTQLINSYSECGLTTEAHQWNTQCGFCGHQVLDDPPAMVEEICELVTANTDNPTPMGLLHHLEKMGYLDGSTLDATGEARVVNYDYQTLKHQLSRARQDVVVIPSRITRDRREALQQCAVELEIGTDVVPQLNDSTLYATTKVLLAIPFVTNDYQSTFAYGSTDLGITGVTPINMCHLTPDLYMATRPSITQDAPVMKESNTLLIDMNILRMDPMWLITECLRRKITTAYYVTPMLELDQNPDQTILDGEVQFRKVENQIYVITAWSDRPIRVTTENYMNWTKVDAFVIGENTYPIDTVREANGISLRRIDLAASSTFEMSEVVETVGDSIEISVPTVYYYGKPGKRKLSMSGEKKVKLHRELYRRMMIRNVSGTNSFKELVDYGIGISNMKYNINDMVVSFSDISDDTIRHTAAFVYSKMITRANSMQLTERVLESVNTARGFLASLLISQAETMLKITGLDETMLTTVNRWMSKGSEMVRLKGMLMNINSLDIDNLMCYSREPVIRHLRAQETLELEPTGTCPHKTPDFVIKECSMCECCGVNPAIGAIGFCSSCLPTDKHQCDHPCKHAHESEAGTRCSCCLLPIAGEACPCCGVNRQIESEILFENSEESADEAEEQNRVRKNSKPRRPDREKGNRSNNRNNDSRRTDANHHSNVNYHHGHNKPQRQGATQQPPKRSAALHPENDDNDTPDSTPTVILTADPTTNPPGERQAPGGDNIPHENDIPGPSSTTTQSSPPDDTNYSGPEHNRNIQNHRIRLIAQTNEFFGDLYAYGNDIAVKKNSHKLMPPNEQRLRSCFQFMNMGDSIYATENLEVIKTYNTSGEGGYCGYNALKILYPNLDLTLEEMQEIVGSETQFSDWEIMRVAQAKQLNLIVVTERCALVNKSVCSNEFGVICHCRHRGVMLEHWEAALAIQKGFADYHPTFTNALTREDLLDFAKSSGLNKNKVRSFVLGDPRLLKLQTEMHESLSKVVEDVNPAGFVKITKGSTHYVTNDRNNLGYSPQYGTFTAQITEDNQELVELLLLAYSAPARVIHTDWFYDRPESVPADATQGIHDYGKQLVRDIAEVNQACAGDLIKSELIQNRVDCKYEYINNHLFKVQKTGKLKPGDLISGKLVGIQSTSYVDSHVIGYVIRTNQLWCTCVTEKCAKATKIKVDLYRKNTGSGLRALFGIFRWDFRRDIKTLLEKATAVDAIAGWGKSTEIVKLVNQDCTVVAQTSAAVSNILEKLEQGGKKNMCKVMSIEKCMTQQVNTPTLVLDEASMITWETLSLITGPQVENVYLYGNTLQICVLDMYRTGGSRATKSILEQAGIIRRHYTTHRIGNPLARELSLVTKELTTNAKHETNFCTKSWDAVRWAELTSIAGSLEEPVILCFYNNAVRAVMNYLKVGCRVDTIHKFQGLEADNVIVLQWCPTGQTPGRITLDKHQCLSAATRAKKNLVWISVNEYSNNVPLHKRMGATIGGSKHTQPDTENNLADKTLQVVSHLLSKVMIYSKDKTIERLECSRLQSQEEGNLVMLKNTLTHLDVDYVSGNDQHSLRRQGSGKLNEKFKSMLSLFSKEPAPDHVSSSTLGKLAEIVDQANANKDRINSQIMNIYTVQKNLAISNGGSIAAAVTPVLTAMLAQKPGITKAECSFDEPTETLTANILMLGVNVLKIQLDFRNDKVILGSGGLRSFVADSSEIKQLYNQKFNCCGHYVLKYRNFDTEISVKKKMNFERVLWIVNYFGVCLESGSLHISVTIENELYKMQSYGGCSLCGGMVIFHHNKPIIVGDPSYNTGNSRTVRFNSKQSDKCGPILAYLRLWNVDSGTGVKLPYDPPVGRGDFDMFEGDNVMAALVIERVLKGPWMMAAKLKNMLTNTNQDLCNFYDNNSPELFDSLKARLESNGFTNFNTNLVNEFVGGTRLEFNGFTNFNTELVNVNSMDLRCRPILCTLDKRYLAALMDQDNLIWVTQISGKPIHTPAGVTRVSNKAFKTMAVRQMLNRLEFKLTNTQLSRDKPMGAPNPRGPLLKFMAQHEADNDKVAVAARKYKGQTQAAMMKLKSRRMYLTAWMVNGNSEYASNIMQQHNVITTSTNYPENNMLGLVDLYVAQAIHNTGYTSALYITNNACTAVLCGHWDWFSCPPDDGWSTSRFLSSTHDTITNLADIKSILDSEIAKLDKQEELSEEETAVLKEKKERSERIHNQILRTEDSWYSESYQNVKRGTVIVSVNSCGISTESIEKIMETTGAMEFLMCVPTLTPSDNTTAHRVGVTGSNNVKITYPGARNTLTPNPEIVYCMKSGKRATVQSQTKKDFDMISLHTTTVAMIASVQILKVTITRFNEHAMPKALPIPFSPFSHQSDIEKVWVQYPRFTCNFGDGSENSLIITKRRKLVSKALLAKMNERALRHDSNLKDLQAYGRSYLMTQVYTERYVNVINKNGLDELEAVCIAALTMKHRINEQLEHTMGLMETFRYVDTDSITDIVVKSCKKNLLEKVMSIANTMQEKLGIPASFTGLLDEIANTQRVVFIDERTNQSRVWSWDSNIKHMSDEEGSIKKWWASTADNLDWMNIGMIQEYRKVLCRKEDIPKKTKACPGFKQVVDCAKAVAQQKEARKTDPGARVLVLEEPIPLIGNVDITRAATQGTMVTKNENVIRSEITFRARQSIRRAQTSRLRSYLDNWNEMVKAYSALEAGDLKVMVRELMSRIAIIKSTSTPTWHLKEDLEAMLDVPNLTRAEHLEITKLIGDAVVSRWEQSKAEKKQNEYDFIKSDLGLSTLNDHDLNIVLSLLAVDRPSKVKKDLLTNTLGSQMSVNEAVMLRRKIRQQWCESASNCGQLVDHDHHANSVSTTEQNQGKLNILSLLHEEAGICDINLSDASPLKIRASSYLPEAITTCVQTPGMYELTSPKVEIIYEAMDNDECVWRCIEKYVTQNIEPHFRITNGLRAIMQQSKMLTESQAIIVCQLLGLNCCLIQNGETGTVYNFAPNKPFVQLMRLSQDASYDHCVLINLLGADGVKRLSPENIAKENMEQLEHVCPVDNKPIVAVGENPYACVSHVHIDNEDLARLTSCSQPYEKIPVLDGRFEMLPVNNVMARMTRKTSSATLLKKVTPITTGAGSLALTRNYYKATPMVTTKPGDVLVVLRDHCEKKVMCTHTTIVDTPGGVEQILEITDDIGDGAVCLDLGLHCLTPADRTPRRDRPVNTSNEVWSLNIETQRYLEATKGLRSHVGQGEGKLHIYHFDNREHHMYDEHDYIDAMLDENIVIELDPTVQVPTGVNIVNLICIRRMFRLAMLYGIPTWVAYCDDNPSAAQLAWFLKYYKMGHKVFNNNVTTEDLTNTRAMEIINALFSTYQHTTTNHTTRVHLRNKAETILSKEKVSEELFNTTIDISVFTAVLMGLENEVLKSNQGTCVFDLIPETPEPPQLQDDMLESMGILVDIKQCAVYHVPTGTKVALRVVESLSHEIACSTKVKGVDPKDDEMRAGASNLTQSVPASDKADPGSSQLSSCEENMSQTGTQPVACVHIEPCDHAANASNDDVLKEITQPEQNNHDIISKILATAQKAKSNPEDKSWKSGATSADLQAIQSLCDSPDGMGSQVADQLAKKLEVMNFSDEVTLSGIHRQRNYVNSQGKYLQRVDISERWAITYKGIGEHGSDVPTNNPGWWWLAFPPMRKLGVYKEKHEIKVTMNYAGNCAYRLNRIKFREPKSVFTHNVKPEVMLDILTYTSANNKQYPTNLQRLADKYLHGRVSWHVVYGEGYNRDFLQTCVELTKRMERVIVVTDAPDVYNQLDADIQVREKIITIKVTSQPEPYRAIWWRFMILFANIDPECELYILNGREMAPNDMELVDRVMEESFEDFDIVSALHCQAFNVCCGYAKYNHAKFTDYNTFNDIYEAYGNSYGGDEIYMSRYKVKMMWLYYILPGGAWYGIEGKWLNYALDTTICLELKEGERTRIDHVKGLFCSANFFHVAPDTKGIYDYSTVDWSVDGIPWQYAMQIINGHSVTENPVRHSTGESTGNPRNISNDGEKPWQLNPNNWLLDPGLKKSEKMKIQKFLDSDSSVKCIKESQSLPIQLGPLKPIVVFANQACEAIGVSMNNTGTLYVEVNIAQQKLAARNEPLQHQTLILKSHLTLMSTTGRHASWKPEYTHLMKADLQNCQVYVEGSATSLLQWKREETQHAQVYTTEERDVFVRIPQALDHSVGTLKTLEVKVTGNELGLSSSSGVLARVLKLNDRLAWNHWLETQHLQKLLEFDRRIISSHEESSGMTFKPRIGQTLYLADVLTAAGIECVNHITTTSREWKEALKNPLTKVGIMPLTNSVLVSGKLGCVQPTIPRCYAMLCQGVKLKIFKPETRGGGTPSNVSANVGPSNPTTAGPGDTPPLITSWNKWVESGASNQSPFGVSAKAYQDKLREKKIETPQDRLRVLETMLFDDAYALMSHGLTDLRKLNDGGNWHCATDATMKSDFEIIEPVGGDLLPSLNTSALRHNETNARVIDLWDDTDLRDWLTLYAPKNPMKLTSRVSPGQGKINLKTLLTNRPCQTRPVPTQVMGMGENAVTGRLGSVLPLRREPMNVTHELHKFRTAYYRDGWERVLKDFKANTITISDADVKTWLSRRSDWKALATSTIKMLETGLPSNPMNAVNVHVKTESLLKANPIMYWRQTQGRIIVWQPKELCALMSPAFIAIKRRLKEVLRDEIVYTDGLTPDMLSARARTIQYDYVFEDDLVIQDRQTDQELIDLEFQVMLDLGLDINLANLWRLVHNKWRFKGQHSWGQLDAMRLTGQATTALGNAITNLCVHSSFVIEHRQAIKLMFVLGDDNITFMSAEPNLTKYKRLMSERYNMRSKPQVSRNVGTFCSLLCYRNSFGHCEVGPDFVRLRHRFEVTGGGNHYELPVVAVKMPHNVRIGKTFFNGRYLHVMENEEAEMEPVEWLRNHANRSYILVLKTNSAEWSRLDGVQVHDLSKIDTSGNLAEALEGIGASMGMPNPMMAAGMSYLHMLGKSEEADKINTEKEFGLELRKWYDVASCKNATCIKYNMSPMELEDNIGELLKMIRKPMAYHKRFLTTAAYSAQKIR